MTTTLTPTTAGQSRSKLPSLTGLRWVAAMLVFGFHVGTMRIIAEPDYQAVVGKLFTLGLSGVQFFFILSGFVLVWSARPGDTPLAFWRRRIAKIFPNHVVLWAAVLLLGIYFADPFNLKVALTNLFLVQAWNPTPGWFYSVNTVSWSLSCELFFYLCLPLVLPLIRRLRPWALVAIVVAMPLLILAMWPGQLLVPEPDRWWFTQVFPLVRSLEFWMGVAAAELMVRGRWRGPNLKIASVIFVVTWVAASQWIRAELWTTLLAAVYVLVIAAAADADVRGTWSPWRSRPMRWLGEVSFAYYLVHVFVVTSVLRATNHLNGFPGWQGPAAAVGFLLLNLLLAGLLFHFVETPMMRLLSPRRRRPHSMAAVRIPRQTSAGDRTAREADAARDPERVT
ncbi:peptidoglycan/LPS O-acetylase OafA/YrhL [Micromonospora pisi]|uniref:Peptidoglycan/LPS O-acetylase OafA/YrhL n=1 Tax=Micromonospora pisi TaxID=589240 RepID=A0A495JPI5_9ACTN|nr:acyltransferase [Micromonospora pisi]RKR90761.1 peptidoglycan/LPS O-acetylase OafA/YrhL [Micromonospora pisi]